MASENGSGTRAPDPVDTQNKEYATDSNLSPDSQPRVKRSKISIACEPCRARKSRCNGERPVCGACDRRPHDSRPCVWNETKAEKPSEGSVFSYFTISHILNSLVERIYSYEHLLTVVSTPQLLQRIRDLELQLQAHTQNDRLSLGEPPSARNEVLGKVVQHAKQGNDEVQDISKASSTTLSSELLSGEIRNRSDGEVQPSSASTGQSNMSSSISGYNAVNAMGATSFTDDAHVPDLTSNAFYVCTVIKSLLSNLNATKCSTFIPINLLRYSNMLMNFC